MMILDPADIPARIYEFRCPYCLGDDWMPPPNSKRWELWWTFWIYQCGDCGEQFMHPVVVCAGIEGGAAVGGSDERGN